MGDKWDEYDEKATVRRRVREEGARLIYLSGTWSSLLPSLRGDVGLMLQPRSALEGHLSEVPTFAVDNGCFRDPDGFDLGRYLAWIDRLPRRALFVTAPDVPFDAEATLEKASALSLIRALGFKAALVAQDGLTVESTPWADLDCLFIGGTTRWKLSSSAAALCKEANRRGKWVHVGRVNSARRLRHAAWMGADSVDGNFLKFGPEKNIAKMEKWFRQEELWQARRTGTRLNAKDWSDQCSDWPMG